MSEEYSIETRPPAHVTLTLAKGSRHYLQECARIRNISVTRLATRLINAIARDQLVLAILDDDSKPVRHLEGESGTSRVHRYRE